MKDKILDFLFEMKSVKSVKMHTTLFGKITNIDFVAKRRNKEILDKAERDYFKV